MVPAHFCINHNTFMPCLQTILVTLTREPPVSWPAQGTPDGTAVAFCDMPGIAIKGRELKDYTFLIGSGADHKQSCP
jgi:hypothetical protein